MKNNNRDTKIQNSIFKRPKRKTKNYNFKDKFCKISVLKSNAFLKNVKHGGPDLVFVVCWFVLEEDDEHDDWNDNDEDKKSNRSLLVPYQVRTAWK